MDGLAGGEATQTRALMAADSTSIMDEQPHVMSPTAAARVDVPPQTTMTPPREVACEPDDDSHDSLPAPSPSLLPCSLCPDTAQEPAHTEPVSAVDATDHVKAATKRLVARAIANVLQQCVRDAPALTPTLASGMEQLSCAAPAELRTALLPSFDAMDVDAVDGVVEGEEELPPLTLTDVVEGEEELPPLTLTLADAPSGCDAQQEEDGIRPEAAVLSPVSVSPCA